MSCKAYVQWHGLRLGWVSAEFLNINQYISNAAFEQVFCFWNPSFLCSLTTSWKKIFWRKSLSAHQRNKAASRCKAAVGLSEIWGEILTVCLVAEVKGRMINFYKVIISSLLSCLKSPTTLLSLILAIKITASVIRNGLTSLHSSFLFC